MIEDVAQLERHPAAVEDAGRRPGIEVEHHRGRVPRIRHRPLVGVQFERGQVAQPHQRRELLDDASLLAAPGDHGLGRDPLRVVRWASLLEEPFAVGAVRGPHQGGRPARQMGQHDRRDPGEIVDDVGFRESRGRVEDLVQVREGQLPTLDLYLNPRRHK